MKKENMIRSLAKISNPSMGRYYPFFFNFTRYLALHNDAVDDWKKRYDAVEREKDFLNRRLDTALVNASDLEVEDRPLESIRPDG